MFSIDFQRRNLLADPVACPDLVRPADVPGTAFDLRRVWSGRTEYGQDWHVPLAGGHILVAGATGAGKTSVMWCPLVAIAPAIREVLVRSPESTPRAWSWPTALQEQDCTLAAQGWGELALGESRPAAGKRWTDSGEVHDRRGLKHRGEKEVRLVQIPPVLVGILREHLDRFGTGPVGGCSRTERRHCVVLDLFPGMG